MANPTSTATTAVTSIAKLTVKTEECKPPICKMLVAASQLGPTFTNKRHILNIAACDWRDEQRLTWLEYAPRIKLLPVQNGRAPYPLTREEQALLFAVSWVPMRQSSAR